MSSKNKNDKDTTTTPVSWQCPCCNKQHAGELPLAMGAPYPEHYWMIPEAERDQRIDMPNQDFCQIDGTAFYIRGRFLIPIIDSPNDEYFSWDAWVSQSQANYKLALDHMTLDNRETVDPPTFGYLSTELASAFEGKTTFNLPTQVTTETVGLAPALELEPACEHPLAVDQRNGMTLEMEHLLFLMDCICHAIN